jgi:hypothetical protein
LLLFTRPKGHKLEKEKKPTVALPSTEVEYMASTNATKEAIRLQELCEDFVVL